LEVNVANYLKGIGDAATRVNEILPSLDARINNFLCGHTVGIIRGEFNEFYATAIDRGIIVRSGMFQAHGYFGASDTDTQINFVMPSTTQYVHLYAEIDLSVVPNRFEVKATPMSNSSAYTFRQDNLRTVTNGKYQFQLWQVTLTASTIILTERRAVIDRPSDAVTAENYLTTGGATAKINSLAPLASPALTGSPTAPTPEQTENSNRVATTSYVRQAVSDVKNITYSAIATNRVVNITTNELKRQVNFVVGNFENGRSTVNNVWIEIGNVLGTIPTGYRPSAELTIGVRLEWYTAGAVISTWIATNGVLLIRTNGEIVLQSRTLPSGYTESTSENTRMRVFRFNFGYEIT